MCLSGLGRTCCFRGGLGYRFGGTRLSLSSVCRRLGCGRVGSVFGLRFGLRRLDLTGVRFVRRRDVTRFAVRLHVDVLSFKRGLLDVLSSRKAL